MNRQEQIKWLGRCCENGERAADLIKILFKRQKLLETVAEEASYVPEHQAHPALRDALEALGGG